jgi:1,4-dihydroxy-6-naphthoate synthase
MKLTLGFSPCPNDTFIFDAMVNGKIDTRGLEFEYVLADVETLNQWAEEGKLDITKLSFSTFLRFADRYGLLHAGSALGVGVGPILVAKQPLNLDNIDNLKIAIPGTKTTANLLFTLAFPNARNKTEMVFSEIEAAVLSGQADAGLLIHEGRFTYRQKGLHLLADMGDWWQKTANAHIPLGGIAVSRHLDKSVCSLIDTIMVESIADAWRRYPNLSEFVTQNAQEMDEQVMRQHINLYVNEYTADLGETGIAAVKVLFNKAKEIELIDTSPENIFY